MRETLIFLVLFDILRINSGTVRYTWREARRRMAQQDLNLRRRLYRRRDAPTGLKGELLMSEQRRTQRETAAERKERRARERRIKKRILLVISIIVVLLALLIVGVLVMLLRARVEAEGNTFAGETVESLSITYVGEKTEFVTETPTPETTPEPTPKITTHLGEIPEINGDGLVSQKALMLRLADGAVVYDKNSTEMMYPASMAKMMTVLLAIENVSDLKTEYTFTGEEIDAAWLAEASRAGFEPGETVPVMDLLYGAMLPSGADACYAIANVVSGSEAEFVNLMNAKAAELGMTGTNFTNCTGLQDDYLVSTCQDMAALLSYALDNPTFRSVFTAHLYTTAGTPFHEVGLVLSSTTFSYLEKYNLDNGTVIEGGKTGYTDEAGRCLASLAVSYDGVEYILVTADAIGYSEYDYVNASDAIYMYNQLPGPPPEETEGDGEGV